MGHQLSLAVGQRAYSYFEFKSDGGNYKNKKHGAVGHASKQLYVANNLRAVLTRVVSCELVFAVTFCLF